MGAGAHEGLAKRLRATTWWWVPEVNNHLPWMCVAVSPRSMSGRLRSDSADSSVGPGFVFVVRAVVCCAAARLPWRLVWGSSARGTALLMEGVLVDYCSAR